MCLHLGSSASFDILPSFSVHLPHHVGSGVSLLFFSISYHVYTSIATGFSISGHIAYLVSFQFVSLSYVPAFFIITCQAFWFLSILSFPPHFHWSNRSQVFLLHKSVWCGSDPPKRALPCRLTHGQRGCFHPVQSCWDTVQIPHFDALAFALAYSAARHFVAVSNTNATWVGWIILLVQP